MTNRFFKVSLLKVTVLAAILAYPSTALSQIPDDDPPEGGIIGGGANSVSGKSGQAIPLVSIGAGPGALAHTVSVIGQGEFSASSSSRISISDTAVGGEYSYNVILPGSQSLRFMANAKPPVNATVFSEYINRGNTLSYNNGTYTFTSANGAIAIFDDHDPDAPRATSITGPDGTTLTYSYIGDDLSSVQSNIGYQLKYQNPATAGEVRAINNAVEYCNPIATSCSVASHWAKGTVSSNGVDYTDAENRTYSVNAFGNSQLITYPGGTKTDMAVYNNFGDLMTTVTNNVTTTYVVTEDTKGTPNDEDDDERTTVTNLPGGGSTTTVSRVKGGLIISQTNVLSQTTSYTYNSDNLIDTITFPRGDSVEYTYDSRGNVTEVRRKPTSGSNHLVTSAAYPSSCSPSTQKYCNKPIWTKDVMGNQTDYAYHSQSGNVASITAPSDGTNSRPVTSFTYTQLTPKVKNSSGVLVNSTPVWKLHTVTQFAGTSKQAVVTMTYNLNLNLTPISAVTSSGGITNTVTATFDNYGNQLTQDGPLPGTDDVSASYYDKLRRVIGSIGVDPDGSGSIARRAIRPTYTALGVTEKTDVGTATGYSLAALNGMTVLQTQLNHHDAHGRVTRSKLQALGTTYAAQDYSYDGSSRIECTATRMNAASLSGGASNACSLGTQGAFGADRITKRVYDTASRVTQTISAFGTSQPITQTATYYSYGPIKFATDGNGNQSYFTYDGFTRPERTYYPNASGSGYNASDYVQYYYDSYGRQNQVRQRDGQTVYFSFNDHGRTTLINAPGSAEDTTLAYDIMGNTTSVSKPGQSLTYSYDGRGLLTGETSSLGTVSYVYDSYGRRTRMNYPGSDNFYVTYDYLAVGGLGAIKEKGAATLASFSYDSQGRRDVLTFNGSTSKSYSYDAMSRLTGITNNLSGTSMDQTLSFTRSPSGQIATQTNSNTAYDPIPKIYDATSIINGLNQITSQTGTSTFAYDAAGNLTSGAGNSYGYDYANRLTSTSGTGGAGTLTYDPASRLRTLTSGGVVTSFLYDGQNVIAEYEGGVLTKRYVHGPGSDEPLVEYTGTGTLNKVWLISDSRGSITGHVNGSGTSVATNSYDSYGVPGTSNTGRFQYTGQMYLEEIGLYYYKARFYSADLKRFLQTDPIGYGDGLNMYAYVGGDPMNFTDPSGLKRVKCDEDPSGYCVVTTGTRTTRRRPVYIYSTPTINPNLYNNFRYIPLGRGGVAPTPDTAGSCPHVSISTSLNGNTLTINVNLTFSGPGATPQNVAAYTNAIQSAWTASFAGSSVITTATNGNSPNSLPIYVDAGQITAEASLPMRLSNLNGTSATTRAGNLWAAGHEFGHFLSLNDRYNQSSGYPYLGYDNTMMGQHGSPLTEGELSALIEKVISCKPKP